MERQNDIESLTRSVLDAGTHAEDLTYMLGRDPRPK
jgi:hypothetical protein